MLVRRETEETSGAELMSRILVSLDGSRAAGRYCLMRGHPADRLGVGGHERRVGGPLFTADHYAAAGDSEARSYSRRKPTCCVDWHPGILRRLHHASCEGKEGRDTGRHR